MVLSWRGNAGFFRWSLKWWVVQDDSGFALALRVVAASATLSRFARLEPERSFSPALNAQYANDRVVCNWGVYLRWWVVQDDSGFALALRVVAASATLSRFARLEPERSFSPALNAQYANDRVVCNWGVYLRWWVVQDSNLRPID